MLAPRLRLLVGANPRLADAVRYGDLTLHPVTARAEWRGHDIGLTLSEYKDVSMLVAAAGMPVSFRSIYDRVRSEGFIAGSGKRGYAVNVRGIVKRIRRKFWSVDQAFDRIGTVMATGYYWEPMLEDDRTSVDEERHLRCVPSAPLQQDPGFMTGGLLLDDEAELQEQLDLERPRRCRSAGRGAN